MFPEALQTRARGIAETVVAPLAAIGMTPNTATVLGFVLNVVTAGVIATGHLTAGGILLFFSAGFDMLDGALARVMQRQSSFGAFLDSLLDRYSESAILAALIYVFTIQGETGVVLLAYVAAVGSIMISYARARAEGLGLQAKVGIAPRPERVIILGIGLLISLPTTVAALVVLAFLTHVTAIQRLYHVWRQTHESSARTEPVEASKERVTPRDGAAHP
jgi:CDP-diacylglycerol--glycerol-3-phosphate 3-phosphatidyltransferase